MHIVVVLHLIYFSIAEDGKEVTNSDAPENNPQYTTVYVGNLAQEVRQIIAIIHFNASSYTLFTP